MLKSKLNIVNFVPLCQFYFSSVVWNLYICPIHKRNKKFNCNRNRLIFSSITIIFTLTSEVLWRRENGFFASSSKFNFWNGLLYTFMHSCCFNSRLWDSKLFEGCITLTVSYIIISIIVIASNAILYKCEA